MSKVEGLVKRKEKKKRREEKAEKKRVKKTVWDPSSILWRLRIWLFVGTCRECLGEGGKAVGKLRTMEGQRLKWGICKLIGWFVIWVGKKAR